MCFGGTFDPAYVMSLHALAPELQPTTNRRNAALIQKHMHEAIEVPPSRGVLRFVAAAEENLAHNGKTTAGEMEDAAREGPVGASGESPSLASRRTRASRKLGAKASCRRIRPADPPLAANCGAVSRDTQGAPRQRAHAAD